MLHQEKATVTKVNLCYNLTTYIEKKKNLEKAIKNK